MKVEKRNQKNTIETITTIINFFKRRSTKTLVLIPITVSMILFLLFFVFISSDHFVKFGKGFWIIPIAIFTAGLGGIPVIIRREIPFLIRLPDEFSKLWGILSIILCSLPLLYLIVSKLAK
ncbi:MAG: hypothetical protein CVU42_08950 [Chloroflexi bacterium HGW-Chloroflexi-4]|jgi:hypothetical protein|nr:MAG: hypothetical protein CVU42_08950 [Chloroflexi bacterium HGW-Chloroflexi-4]